MPESAAVPKPCRSQAIALTGKRATVGSLAPPPFEQCSINKKNEIPRRQAVIDSAGMRIVVDLNRCLGYAQCAFLAPDVFKLNGEEALMYDPNPDEATRLRVLRAAAACPVQAIVVEDRPEEKHKVEREHLDTSN
jgi:ferredoxin